MKDAANPAPKPMHFLDAMLHTILLKQAVYSHTLGGTVVSDRTDTSRAWFIHRVTNKHPVPMIVPWTPEAFPDAASVHDWTLSTDNWSS